MQRVQNDAVTAYYDVLPQHLPEETERKAEKVIQNSQPPAKT
jgi:hypothetical protein